MAINQNLCKIDNVPAVIPHIFCFGCLNDWLRVRKAIQARLTAVFGPATRETLPIITQEMARLNALWKRDRDAFENEARTWY
jgi:hypothetical protein